jgi:hypothetical protein
MSSRADLMKKKFKINQLRNAVYDYINYLKIDKQVGSGDILNLLKQMGHRIATTYANYWKPTGMKDALDFMREIHRTVFKTAARVRQESDSQISVVSRSCPLCRYKYENLDVAGCNLIVGFIETFFEIQSKTDPNLPRLEGTVETSRTFGESYCKYTFEVKK